MTPAIRECRCVCPACNREVAGTAAANGTYGWRIVGYSKCGHCGANLSAAQPIFDWQASEEQVTEGQRQQFIELLAATRWAEFDGQTLLDFVLHMKATVDKRYRGEDVAVVEVKG